MTSDVTVSAWLFLSPSPWELAWASPSLLALILAAAGHLAAHARALA